MKIFALVTDAFGGWGGIARYNQDFLSALSSTNGVSRIVVAARTAKTKFESLPPKITWNLARFDKFSYVFTALMVFFKAGPFDLIFCGHLRLAPLAAILAWVARLPFWLQIYGIEVWERKTTWWRWAAKRASLITAISRYTRQRFLSWADVSPEKVHVLPCTFDHKFQPGPKPEYLLNRYGLRGKKVLLTLSRLASQEKYKGHDRIIHLMPQLLQKYPNLVYVIAGEGDDRPRLEAVVREQALDGVVRFIGAVEESELVDLYRLADLFVMASTDEGFGIVFLEATACGIPVIGGREDGSFDALLEGRMGRVVDPNEAGELEEAIASGLASPKERPKAIERFSRLNFLGHVEDLLREATSICSEF